MFQFLPKKLQERIEVYSLETIFGIFDKHAFSLSADLALFTQNTDLHPMVM